MMPPLLHKLFLPLTLAAKARAQHSLAPKFLEDIEEWNRLTFHVANTSAKQAVGCEFEEKLFWNVHKIRAAAAGSASRRLAHGTMHAMLFRFFPRKRWLVRLKDGVVAYPGEASLLR